MDRKEFLQQVQGCAVAGAYLFEGPEENLKAEALEALRTAILPAGLEELNETIMDAPAADAIRAACETMPFMADKRLVIVRDQPGLTGRQEADEALVSYLPQVPDSCVLIFLCVGKADGRKKLYTTLKKLGHIVTFAPMTEDEVGAWVVRAFRELGKGCSAQTASRLIFTTGRDTAQLQTEIAKLAAYAGERDAITDADVDVVATRSLECTVFNMVDAVVAGQEGKAFAYLRDMLMNGEDRIGILAMLLRQFRLMQHVKIMQYEKVAVPAIRQKLGLPSFAADRMLRQAQGYSGGAIKQAVDICLTTEYMVKSGQMNMEGSLETAMLQIFALRRR